MLNYDTPLALIGIPFFIDSDCLCLREGLGFPQSTVLCDGFGRIGTKFLQNKAKLGLNLLEFSLIQTKLGLNWTKSRALKLEVRD